MSERVDSISIEIREKENALPGNRILAVGMCFYRPSKDLNTGQRYTLHHNLRNPKDVFCIELKHHRIRATLNKNISQLLASYLDSNTIAEPTW